MGLLPVFGLIHVAPTATAEKPDLRPSAARIMTIERFGADAEIEVTLAA